MKKPYVKDFIYQNKISSKVCEDILKYYFANEHLIVEGSVRGGVNKNIKDSYDIVIPFNFEEYPFNAYLQELQKCVNEYVAIFYEISRVASVFNLNENYIVQRYAPGGGFKQLHCERSGTVNANRVLVFMTYLNTIKNAGTFFPFQNLTTEAVIGNTVLWPAEWTHSHKGIINKLKEKFIITGWLGF
jgi:hypothetical protein